MCSAVHLVYQFYLVLALSIDVAAGLFSLFVISIFCYQLVREA